MLSPLIVVVAVALAPSSTMAQGECGCNIEYLPWAECRNTSLTSIPDCVPSNITSLSIGTPSIPLVADTIRRFTNVTIMDISYFDQPQISKTFLEGHQNMIEFYIFYTSLDYVDRDWFLDTTRIRVLSLENNKIASLPADTFSSMPLLRSLYLNNNALTTLPPTLLEGTALEYIYLAANPWNCDCDLATVIQWTRDHGVKIVDQATCSYPSELEGSKLVDLTTDLVCKR